MASDSEIKRREAIALDRVLKASENLAARFPDIETPTIPARHRYTELLPLLRMEAIADFLDALDASMTDETAPDTPEAPPANDAPKTDVTPAAARTAVVETIKQAPAKPKRDH
jgi:hypothetical protein